jgi:uncharacterized protein YdaU (DUF1376 family)
MDKKRKPPLWMPIYVADLIADTAHLTTVQFGAYVRLLCAMWRSEDGTLSDNPETLGRLTGVHAPRWPGVWRSINAFISIDGGKLTNDGLRAELAKAKAITAVRQATGRLGGETTQLRLRHSQPMSRIHRSPMTAPNPLGTNDVAQANAKHNTTQQIKTKEERSGEPRPETGSPSLDEKKAFSEEPVVVQGASDSPLERALNNWGENFKHRQGGKS